MSGQRYSTDKIGIAKGDQLCSPLYCCWTVAEASYEFGSELIQIMQREKSCKYCKFLCPEKQIK